MDTRVNYTLVGLFVIILGAALTTVIFWLSADDSDVVYQTYVAYFYESVSGLNLRAPVKYRGVGVGQVRRISLDKDNPERVKILLDIEESTPIKANTKAVITPQGITGLAFVDLTGGSKNSPPLKVKEGESYPEILTKRSVLGELESAGPMLITQVGQLTTQLGHVVNQLSKLLNEDNQGKITRTLGNLEQFTGVLAARSGEVEKTMESLSAIADNTARASAELPALARRASGSVATLEEAVGGINATTRHLDELIVTSQRDLSRFSQDTLPQVGPLLTELRQLSENLRRLTRDLEREPNSLLFGRPASQPGPGE